MSLIFFVKSSTVEIEKFNIKDIPGSSGRLDVISRCILSALIGYNNLEKNVQIWVFLDKYGTFIFDSNAFYKESFPISEIKFAYFFVQLIIDKLENRTNENNPLNLVKYSKLNFFEEIKKIMQTGYKIIVLCEDGKPFYDIISTLIEGEKILFIIGDQTGEVINSDELKDLNLITMSLGKKSYLASSIIRLIKLNLTLLRS